MSFIHRETCSCFIEFIKQDREEIKCVAFYNKFNNTHERFQKVLQEGVHFFDVFVLFLLYEVQEDPNTSKSGPSWAHQ